MVGFHKGGCLCALDFVACIDCNQGRGGRYAYMHEALMIKQWLRKRVLVTFVRRVHVEVIAHAG